MNDIQKAIIRLKKEKNAVILAHNYQAKAILEIADFIGDSFYLSKRAQEVKADIIVFCGVEFMAESAKLLNPSKKVLLPSKEAGCSMADSIEAEDLFFLKKEHPQAKVVAYINTTASVKALVDVCCTSANAVEVVNSLEAKEIIFIPDRNLASYVQTKTNKKIIPWDRGFCFLHTNLTTEKIQNYRHQYPQAELLMHPETPLALHSWADFIYGTGGMFSHIENSLAKEFLIATEEHMCDALSLVYPDKKFIPLMNPCIYMGKITLENTLLALEKEQFEINVPPNIFDKARKSIENMLLI